MNAARTKAPSGDDSGRFFPFGNTTQVERCPTIDGRRSAMDLDVGVGAERAGRRARNDFPR